MGYALPAYLRIPIPAGHTDRGMVPNQGIRTFRVISLGHTYVAVRYTDDAHVFGAHVHTCSNSVYYSPVKAGVVCAVIAI